MQLQYFQYEEIPAFPAYLIAMPKILQQNHPMEPNILDIAGIYLVDLPLIYRTILGLQDLLIRNRRNAHIHYLIFRQLAQMRSTCVLLDSKINQIIADAQVTIV